MLTYGREIDTSKDPFPTKRVGDDITATPLLNMQA
jgi:hypothetical protein